MAPEAKERLMSNVQAWASIVVPVLLSLTLYILVDIKARMDMAVDNQEKLAGAFNQHLIQHPDDALSVRIALLEQKVDDLTFKQRTED